MALAVLAACVPAEERRLPHEAYVWQQVWGPSVSAAVAKNIPGFSGWRVLALELDGETMHRTAPDLTTLAATGLPVRIVVRLEGTRLPPATAGLLQELRGVVAAWRTAKVRVTGIEFDHDCPSARLADYAAWLDRMLPMLPADLPVSITALPAWLETMYLERLLGRVASHTLQVHSVLDPSAGALFDPDRAWGWLAAWSRRSPTGFQLALPAYGLRILLDETGQIRAVDSEQPIASTGSAGREMNADPAAVARLLTRIRAEAPGRLDGLVWFRLPVEGDLRTWHPATLSAVIAGRPLIPRLARVEIDRGNGIRELGLRNTGNVDVAAPPLAVPADCAFGGAYDGFRWEYGAAAPLLVPVPGLVVKAGAERRVAWLRCDTQEMSSGRKR